VIGSYLYPQHLNLLPEQQNASGRYSGSDCRDPLGQPVHNHLANGCVPRVSVTNSAHRQSQKRRIVRKNQNVTVRPDALNCSLLTVYVVSSIFSDFKFRTAESSDRRTINERTVSRMPQRRQAVGAFYKGISRENTSPSLQEGSFLTSSPTRGYHGRFVERGSRHH